MISKILSATVIGLDAQLIQVEVHFSRGRSKFHIVGLPDKACSESRERVSAIIRNLRGRRLPAGTFTVNLSPADIPKSGPVYDLPIAIGILQTIGDIDFESSGKLFIGELSLDGETRHTNAILPIADLVKKKKIEKIFLPKVNAYEAGLIPEINIIPVESIKELVAHFTARNPISSYKRTCIEDKVAMRNINSMDFSFIKGQEFAKRALEVAAAGAHNLLMSGPPGSGKTMLAKSLPSILPNMKYEERIETTKIYSVCGKLEEKRSLVSRRSFRKPHHTISHAGLVGGGTIPQPGEISLAHRGVLFLDEFPEFSKKALESLRQPLEDGVITISRARGTLTFPARFMLVAAMNPCPCGWLGDKKNDCNCTPNEILRYEKRLSGPILDRLDMKIFVKRVEYEKLKNDKQLEKSKTVKKRVEKARETQNLRYREQGILTNSEMGQREIKKYVKIDAKSERLLKNAMDSVNFSARAYFRLLKVARTVADLEGAKNVSEDHILEALSFRMEEVD